MREQRLAIEEDNRRMQQMVDRIRERERQAAEERERQAAEEKKRQAECNFFNRFKVFSKEYLHAPEFIMLHTP